jgi:hypothetical protein
MRVNTTNKYICDRCGEELSREKTATLSTNFAPTGLVGYKQGNMGARHMCSYCKRIFSMAFKGFFSHYNKILKTVKVKTYE